MSDIQSLVSQQLEALLENENNTVSNLSNAAALIFQNYENINWAGFYIYNTETQVLDLGPFQGKVACIFNLEPVLLGRLLLIKKV